MEITASPASRFGEQFRVIIAGLLRATGERARVTPGGYGPPLPPVEIGLVMWTQTYLRLLRNRVLALLARIEAGTVQTRPYRPREPRLLPPTDATGAPDAREAAAAPIDAGEVSPADGAPRRAAAAARPSGFPLKSWLCELAPWKAAGCGGNLDCLLRLPEMAELVAANPRLALMLRPLCRATGQGGSVITLTRIIDAAGITPVARRRAWAQAHAPAREDTGGDGAEDHVSLATTKTRPAGSPGRPTRRRKRKLTASPSKMTTLYFRRL